ncbi:MFS transporter [Acinetobacter sp. CAAS 2-6]|uniref:MFS transporter n=1 Tax=Acinetobacter sp. CAAS 2-6 TaxID=3016358 RepID=UPI002DD6ACDC|nr:MFS transporter [Acinetobacter sp. CAAS 2-6]
MSQSKWMSKDLWIIVAGFVAAMHIGKLPPAVPVLQAELGISLVQAGFLLSLVQGAGMLFALTLGSYTEKIGLKRCIVLGLLLLSIGSYLGSRSHSINLMLMLRVIEGFGFLIVTLSAPALIRKLVPMEKLHVRMGLWSAYMGGGMGISLFITPFLLPYWGWQGVWSGLAVLSAVLAIIIVKVIPHLPTQQHEQVPVAELIKMTLQHPPAWILAGIFGVYAGQWLSLVGFLPTIYQQNQLSLQLAGALTACVTIANAVGTFICGLLLQQGLLPKTLVQSGFVVMMLCTLGFYLFKDQLPFLLQYALVFGFSLFGGLVAAIVFSQALRFAAQPIAISTTVGLVLQFSATSQFVLPPTVAVIVSTTQSWFWVGILMAVFSIIGILLSQRLFSRYG